jgi:hypothetical protein
MKAVKIVLAILVATAAVLAVVAPIGPLPGLFIGGKRTQPPPSWGDTSSTHEILLKVPGTLPRVVTIWVIQHTGDLYVVGARDSGWVKMLGTGGPVEMRMGEETYPLIASAISEDWQPVVQAYADKYRPDYPEIIAGFPPVEEAEGVIRVYRLSRG